MKNKLMISVLAGAALLGPTLAAAECPAFLNAEEGVPCIASKMQENAVDKPASNHASKMPMDTARDNDQHKANIDAWKFMVQNDR